MSTVYDSFLPLIRLLKISLIGVADFGVGLTLAMILDQAFGKIEIPANMITEPNTTQKIENYAYNTFTNKYPTFTDQGVTVQNPLAAGRPYYDRDQLKVVGLTTLGQLIVTLVAGLELRNFFVPYENFLDPTGGIVFVVALLAQPGLWQRSTMILQSIYRTLWWLEQPQKAETGNQA
jgi:hypothetical protein